MNREALAWAGGFYSGEGCTILHRYNGKGKNKKPYPRLHINHTTIEELNRFNSAINNLGKITGPKKSYSPLSKKMYYDLDAYGFDKTQAVITMLWEFLSSAKQDQAVAILKEYNLWGKST